MTKYIAPVLFALICAGVCAGQSQPQSLGDLARNNRNKKAVLVVNEDTISSIDGTVSVVGDDSAPTSTPAAPSSAKETPADKRPAVAAEGNAQVAELKKQLDWEKKQLEGWQQSAKHYEELLAKETNEFRRDTYKQAMANDKTNVTLTQQKIDEVQAQLAKAQQSSGSGDKQPVATPAPADKQP